MNSFKLALLSSILFSGMALAQSDNSIPPSQKLTDSNQYIKLKSKYESCVFAKGLKFAKATDIQLAITYAPKACERDLLQIKKFYLNGPYKIEVINELVESVKQGVEIDLVNNLFEAKIAGKI